MPFLSLSSIKIKKDSNYSAFYLFFVPLLANCWQKNNMNMLSLLNHTIGYNANYIRSVLHILSFMV